MDRRQKKAIQTISYLANKTSEHQIFSISLIKMLWAADKYHLLKYGRTILKDDYYAMEHGPVPSRTFDLLKAPTDYVLEYLKPTKKVITALKNTDTSLFSESDLEVLDLVWNEFGNMDRWVLRDLTHEYPEWKKFEEDLKNLMLPDSFPMEMEDFYNLPENNGKNRSDFFQSIPPGSKEESFETLKLQKKLDA